MNQIKDAFVHEQAVSSAFRISEWQIQAFVGLGADQASAETSCRSDNLCHPTPQGVYGGPYRMFAQEPDSATVSTFAYAEDDVGHYIYKNQYDRPPICYTPKRIRTVAPQAEMEGLNRQYAGLIKNKDSNVLFS